MAKKKVSRGFLTQLDRFIDFVEQSRPSITNIAVDVLPKTARRRLKLKAKDPIIYRGRVLDCRGSKVYRDRHRVARFEVQQ